MVLILLGAGQKREVGTAGSWSVITEENWNVGLDSGERERYAYIWDKWFGNGSRYMQFEDTSSVGYNTCGLSLAPGSLCWLVGTPSWWAVLTVSS